MGLWCYTFVRVRQIAQVHLIRAHRYLEDLMDRLLCLLSISIPKIIPILPLQMERCSRWRIMPFLLPVPGSQTLSIARPSQTSSVSPLLKKAHHPLLFRMPRLRLHLLLYPEWLRARPLQHFSGILTVLLPKIPTIRLLDIF